MDVNCTVSARPDELLRAVEACREAAGYPPKLGVGTRGAEIVGIHVEGPFINRRKKGAQPEEGIRDPDAEECRRLLDAADGLIRVMTLAPELPGALDLIRSRRRHQQGREPDDPEGLAAVDRLASSDPAPDRLALSGELNKRVALALDHGATPAHGPPPSRCSARIPTCRRSMNITSS